VFNERKTKLTLLSLLSAVAIASTAFAGISIYAQTDGSNMTTFEEQAQNATEDTTTTGNATSSANATNLTGGNTSTADVQGLFNGLVVCDVGTAEVNGETQAASVDNSTLGTPTVSVKVMTQTEVAAATDNETGIASANDTSIASAGCKMLGEDTSTSGNATESDMSNATSAGGNTTLTVNATSTSSNMTSTAASDTGSNQQILVIDGQDFAPRQVVLIFSNDQLVGIDDVDGSGNIEAKIPEPHAGSSNSTSTASASTDLRFVESGTLRSGTFSFDGQTLTSAEQGEIQAEGSGNQTSISLTGNATSPATDNSTSSVTNSTSNSTSMQ
jgi:hypothetical protein